MRKHRPKVEPRLYNFIRRSFYGKAFNEKLWQLWEEHDMLTMVNANKDAKISELQDSVRILKSSNSVFKSIAITSTIGCIGLLVYIGWWV